MKILITGNTYPVKYALRELGCKWDTRAKCWSATTEDMAEKARVIVQGKKASVAKSSPASSRPQKLKNPYINCKCQVRPKPCSKYAPFFGAETLDEVKVWLDDETNARWEYAGTDGTFQKRTARKDATGGFLEVEVCTEQPSPSGCGERVYFRMRPCPESYEICHRVTPGKEVGMGNS